jgi:hypothetical protein
MTGRRTPLHLDLARGYAMRRQDAAAVNMLLAAEKLSPQLVRCDPDTRELLSRCCAASTGRPPRSSGRWHAAPESSDPHFPAASLTFTPVRIPARTPGRTSPKARQQPTEGTSRWITQPHPERT